MTLNILLILEVKNKMATNVAIDDELYEEVRKIVEKKDIDYPTINNFVNKAVRKLIGIEK